MSLRPLAVFDVDGTLVDSRATIHRAAVESARGIGMPEPSYDAVRQIVGLSLAQALRELAPELDDANHARFVAGFQGAFQRFHAEPGFKEPLYDGAERTLRRLKREGWIIAMATGNSRRGVERILNLHGWGEVFDTTWCADDGPGKPHPNMITKALEATAAEPRQAIMIGDTSHDMRMAVNAGVYPQGVSWGFHTTEEVAAAGARRVAHSFDELDGALDAFAVTLASPEAAIAG
jgi:phosphoglycolate phosphatase